ncbi:MAG: hypothetical protein MZV70_19660 [Desulfobacterales bacterium]|nr:hypothetical protein [Desulfobacterales bacterium]
MTVVPAPPRLPKQRQHEFETSDVTSLKDPLDKPPLNLESVEAEVGPFRLPPSSRRWSVT